MSFAEGGFSLNYFFEGLTTVLKQTLKLTAFNKVNFKTSQIKKRLLILLRKPLFALYIVITSCRLTIFKSRIPLVIAMCIMEWLKFLMEPGA